MNHASIIQSGVLSIGIGAYMGIMFGVTTGIQHENQTSWERLANMIKLIIFLVVIMWPIIRMF